jgi:hypothetical protein
MPFALPDASRPGERGDLWHDQIGRGTSEKSREMPKSRDANMEGTVRSLHSTDERTVRFSRDFHQRVRLCQPYTTVCGSLP